MTHSRSSSAAMAGACWRRPGAFSATTRRRRATRCRTPFSPPTCRCRASGRRQPVDVAAPHRRQRRADAPPGRQRRRETSIEDLLPTFSDDASLPCGAAARPNACSSRPSCGTRCAPRSSACRTPYRVRARASASRAHRRAATPLRHLRPNASRYPACAAPVSIDDVDEWGGGMETRGLEMAVSC